MEIIERIKECLAQIQPSKYTSNGASAISVRNTNEAMVALNNALKTLPNEVVRSVVVNELFHVERRRRSKIVEVDQQIQHLLLCYKHDLIYSSHPFIF